MLLGWMDHEALHRIADHRPVHPTGLRSLGRGAPGQAWWDPRAMCAARGVGRARLATGTRCW